MKKLKPKRLIFIILGVILLVLIVAGVLLRHQYNKATTFAPTAASPSLVLQPTPTAEPSSMTDRPPAPAGYSWQECTAMKASFLKPDGWFFKEEKKGDTTACFITKEEIIGEKGEFQTGLSVNAITHLSQKSKLKPTEYAKEFLSLKTDKIIKSSELLPWAVGQIKGYHLLKKIHYPGYPEAINMHMIVLGNDETDVLYIIFFESPVSEWDKNIPVGKTMTETFGLDDEY